jgi:hypothetical protein
MRRIKSIPERRREKPLQFDCSIRRGAAENKTIALQSTVYPDGSASQRCTSAFGYMVHRSDSLTGLGAFPAITSSRQLSRLIGTK